MNATITGIPTTNTSMSNADLISSERSLSSYSTRNRVADSLPIWKLVGFLVRMPADNVLGPGARRAGFRARLIGNGADAKQLND